MVERTSPDNLSDADDVAVSTSSSTGSGTGGAVDPPSAVEGRDEEVGGSSRATRNSSNRYIYPHEIVYTGRKVYEETFIFEQVGHGFLRVFLTTL